MSVDEVEIRAVEHDGHSHLIIQGESRRREHVDPPEVVLALLFLVLLSQVGLIYWRKYHYRSFRNVSLVGLWIIPILISLIAGFWRFIFVWTAFSFFMGRTILKARAIPLEKNTPRLVYSWFFSIYKICASCAVFGYSLIVVQIFAISLLVNVSTAGMGMLLLFYGLYFGVIGRDCAEICAEKMASVMGYFSKNGIPSRTLQANTCAICDEKIAIGMKTFSHDESKTTNNPVVIGKDNNEEKIFKLSCGHVYHEFCLRGWLIVGKKDTCAYCKEKVSLKDLFSNPWEARSIQWGALLDVVRYLVVWNPIILIMSGVAHRLIPHHFN